MSIVTIQEDISNAVNMNQIEIQKHPVFSSVLYVQCPFIVRFIPPVHRHSIVFYCRFFNIKRIVLRPGRC